MMTPIIFDLDGTLLDSIEGMKKTYKMTLESFGEKFYEPKIAFCIGRGYSVYRTFEEILPKEKKYLKEEFAQRYISHYPSEMIFGTRLYPNVSEVLEALKCKDMAIATTKKTAYSRETLSNFGISGYFKVVVGGDQVSREGLKKEMIDIILSRLGGSRVSTLIVGDTRADILAGKAAGIKTCAVTYGYGSRNDLKGAEPDYIIGDLKELLGIVD